jgi:hypothetical protein
MLKRDEESHPGSCLNKAMPDELIFVLLARDPAACHAVSEWAKKRVELGLNGADDLKIRQAEDWILQVAAAGKRAKR